VLIEQQHCSKPPLVFGTKFRPNLEKSSHRNQPKPTCLRGPVSGVRFSNSERSSCLGKELTGEEVIFIMNPHWIAAAQNAKDYISAASVGCAHKRLSE
jgi:hypothetical protein